MLHFPEPEERRILVVGTIPFGLVALTLGEMALEGKDYLVGDKFTMADILCITLYFWVVRWD